MNKEYMEERDTIENLLDLNDKKIKQLYDRWDKNFDFNKSKKYLEILFKVCLNKYKLNQRTNLIEKLNGLIVIFNEFEDNLNDQQKNEMNDLIEIFILDLKNLIVDQVGAYERETQALRSKIREVEDFIF